MQQGEQPDQGRFCNKQEQHNSQRVRYICLEDSCMLNRMLCKQCVNEDHRRHKVGVIDKLVAPLNRLCMNSGA